MSKDMKIHYFKEGIKDESFNSVKTTILVDPSKFPDFSSVLDLYVTSSACRRMALFPKAAPSQPLLRDMEVVGKAAAGPAMAVDVVVTCALVGLFLKRKLK